jgi:hypothetical protein
MSLRLSWPWCALALAGLGTAALAQPPDATLAAVVAPAVPTPVTPAPLTPTPAAPTVNPPIDGHERLAWLYVENLGAGSVLDDVAVGAVDTFFNTPKEYKTHWSGFGERTGIVAANFGVKSVMEAGLGSIWGEDPRYFRTTGLSVKGRMAYVIKMTFLAQDRTGKTMPAYSRYLAMPASSFLYNAWMPTSEATVNDALVRTALGFLSRMGENAWKEFIAPRK